MMLQPSDRLYACCVYTCRRPRSRQLKHITVALGTGSRVNDTHAPGSHPQSSSLGSEPGSRTRDRSGTRPPFAAPLTAAERHPLRDSHKRAKKATQGLTAVTHNRMQGVAGRWTPGQETRGAARTLDASQHAADALRDVVHVCYVALIHQLVLWSSEHTERANQQHERAGGTQCHVATPAGAKLLGQAAHTAPCTSTHRYFLLRDEYRDVGAAHANGCQATGLHCLQRILCMRVSVPKQQAALVSEASATDF
jgi:hypothetical protein